jgi:hypothetical protein
MGAILFNGTTLARRYLPADLLAPSSFPASDHGEYQVFAVLYARNDHTTYVQSCQDQRESARVTMEVVDPLHAPECVGRHQNAGCTEDGQSSKKQ